MKEISLNILDIAENSVKAGATLIEIDLTPRNPEASGKSVLYHPNNPFGRFGNPVL